MDTVRLENGTRAVTLILARDQFQNVKIFAPQVSPGCQLYLHAGNIPSFETRDRTLLYVFDEDNVKDYQSSYVRTTAFTFMVPQNCTGSFMWSVLNKATLIADSYKPSNGWSMSYEWVEPFGETQSFNDAMSHSALDSSPNALPVNFVVKSATPGSDGRLTFQNGLSQVNVTNPLKNSEVYLNGVNFTILWYPSQMAVDKGYLVWYRIVASPVQTSISPASQPTTSNVPVSVVTVATSQAPTASQPASSATVTNPAGTSGSPGSTSAQPATTTTSGNQLSNLPAFMCICVMFLAYLH
ncbi:unnamed protein product, partial [Mesorhabditis spiculigera]